MSVRAVLLAGVFCCEFFLKSACPLDGSQCSRAIWTWKSCDLERRLVIQSYLCKNALVYAIRRFMICKRVINCALVIIFALFQNIVLSFDVENFYTRGQVSGLKILPLILRLISAERFWNARYSYDKCAVSYGFCNFDNLSNYCVFVSELDWRLWYCNGVTPAAIRV